MQFVYQISNDFCTKTQSTIRIYLDQRALEILFSVKISWYCGKAKQSNPPSPYTHTLYKFDSPILFSIPNFIVIPNGNRRKRKFCFFNFNQREKKTTNHLFIHYIPQFYAFLTKTHINLTHFISKRYEFSLENWMQIQRHTHTLSPYVVSNAVRRF